MENTNDVQYYQSANWAFIQGNFTPNELREIAEKIESDYKTFQEGQKAKENKKG